MGLGQRGRSRECSWGGAQEFELREWVTKPAASPPDMARQGPNTKRQTEQHRLLKESGEFVFYLKKEKNVIVKRKGKLLFYLFFCHRQRFKFDTEIDLKNVHV